MEITTERSQEGQTPGIVGRFVFAGLILLALMTLLAACNEPHQFKGTQYPENNTAQDFELTAEDGQPYRLSEHGGKIRLLFFGYTSCPDVCPMTLAEARQMLDGLKPEEAGQVEFLFISVDPERDTPERLNLYVNAFHPAITGLTGDPATLAEIEKAYGVIAEKEETGSALGYIINHTARTFLVDQDGNLSLSYRFATPPEDILADVRHLLGS